MATLSGRNRAFEEVLIERAIHYAKSLSRNVVVHRSPEWLTAYLFDVKTGRKFEMNPVTVASPIGATVWFAQYRMWINQLVADDTLEGARKRLDEEMDRMGFKHWAQGVNREVKPTLTLKEIEHELDILRGVVPTPAGYNGSAERAKFLMAERRRLRGKA